jgi:hypothetical protein
MPQKHPMYAYILAWDLVAARALRTESRPKPKWEPKRVYESAGSTASSLRD